MFPIPDATTPPRLLQRSAAEPITSSDSRSPGRSGAADLAGATRGRTEVLSTSVFLEINIGNLPGAAAISLLMILLAVATLLLVRLVGSRSPSP